MTMLVTDEKKIRSGEKILWEGKPSSAVKVRALDVLYYPSCVLTLVSGCALVFIIQRPALSEIWVDFWEKTNSLSAGENIAVLSAIAFMFVSFLATIFYSLVGHLLVESKARSKTTYFVTNERIIAKTGLFSEETHSLQLSEIPEISVFEKPDGSGTIAFQKVKSDLNPASIYGYHPAAPGFVLIPRVREVEAIIRNAQKAFPSVVQVKIKYAQLYKRAGALVVDLITVFAIVNILEIMGEFAGILSPNADEISDTDAFIILLILCATFLLYFSLLEGSSRHATIGKQLFHIQVTKLGGGSLGMGRAFWRSFLTAFLIFKPLLFLFSSMSALTTATRQTVCDLGSKTVVIPKEPSPKAAVINVIPS